VTKYLTDLEIETPLDYIDLADVQHVCSTLGAAPTYAQIVAASLADVAMTPGTDFPKTDGAVSGRKITVAAKSAVPVDVTGTAAHLALVTVSGSVVRAVTDLSATQALTSGNTVNIPAWTIEVRDAT